MVEPVLVIQGIIGGILFFLTGYVLSLVFFKEGEIDNVERVVYSITFSILIPAIAVFVLNILLRIPIFTTEGVYAVFIVLSAGSIGYLHSKNRNPFTMQRKYGKR
ncbi:hypothetical protein KJ765_02740 [Candidatus Micrarchaeota archaeon]|nr:hypothetical protein [Candidatus Micrarchaeota archaeon]